MSSTEALKVIQGKEGYLFLTNDTNQVCSQITGKLILTEKQLFQWKILLEMRKLWLQNQNILYFYFVAPNKECVYSDYLPDHIQISNQRCIFQLMSYLSENSSLATIIYPIDALIEESSKMNTYRKGDTHWTDFGSYVAYRSLALEISSQLSIPIIPSSEIEFIEKTLHKPELFDLGNKIGWKHDKTIVNQILNPRSKCIFDNKSKGTGRLYIYENSDKSLPIAMFFGDSFSHSMIPYLAESFSKLVLIQQPNLDYSLIEKEKPDVVISEQVERFIVRIPDDLKGLSNLEIVEKKKQVKSP